MSNLIIEVKTIDSISVHPNADTLELAIVGGWQTVVGKGQFCAGEKIVYFPPDTVLPIEWSEAFGVTKYLSNGRIRCTKLRGEPSFGLIAKPYDSLWSVGDNVADFYGAKKYEPPIKMSDGDEETPHPLFVKYTDIENLRHYPNVLEDGELVYVTEKIHGTNQRMACIDQVFMAGSHRRRLKEPEERRNNKYWMPMTHNNVTMLLETFDPCILFCEVYGKGIQSLQYGQTGIDFAAFDMMIGGKYLKYDHFLYLTKQYNIPTVPILGTVPYNFETIKKMATGRAFSGDHIREGVVIRPMKERIDPKIGRVIFKYVSDEYLLKQYEDISES